MLTAAWIVVLLFPVSEVTLAVFRRATPAADRVQDRGSMRLLWLVIAASVIGAILLQPVSATRMHLTPRLRVALVVGVIGAGLAIRWAAILTLGKLFTVDVAVQQGHTLVSRGLYRHVRHPSYAGLLLAFAGLGVFFGNWLGLIVLVVPTTLAVVHRMRIEEETLGRTFGGAYAEYCARTKRLVPGIY